MRFGKPKTELPPALVLGETRYGEDYLEEYLIKQGHTEKSSWLLGALLNRRGRVYAGVRKTATGNTLHLVKPQDEVVDDKQGGK